MIVAHLIKQYAHKDNKDEYFANVHGSRVYSLAVRVVLILKLFSDYLSKDTFLIVPTFDQGQGNTRKDFGNPGKQNVFEFFKHDVELEIKNAKMMCLCVCVHVCVCVCVCVCVSEKDER